MRLPGVLVGWLACVVVVWGYDYQDEPNSSQEESIEQQETKNVQEETNEDITPENFIRKKRKWAHLGDEAFEPINNPENLKPEMIKKTTKEIKKLDKKAKQKNRGGFRSSRKTRGSKVGMNKKVEPFQHKPYKKDPKGCGNPICVVIDGKPRRFKSLCEYSEFACKNSRKNQMNFIQKGDCYDIIDNNEGATTKPWTPTDLDLGDCSECKEDDYCKKPITINIDLKNLLFGESSAFGGTYNDADGERMVGVPITFDNVCSLFKYMKSKEHLNIKTQVIGVAIGKSEDIVPLDENSDKCLWTGWFDHGIPCNTDGDTESHTSHYYRMESTYTGDLRICPDCQIVLTQHEGGSEITQNGACEAENGKATGFKGQTPNPFTNIFEKRGPLEIKCMHKDQNITQLPAPFIFAEGIENKKEVIRPGCLDYKARYCCKGNRMYRPTPLEYFTRFIKPRLPLGPAIPVIKVGGDSVLQSATIRISSPTPSIHMVNCSIHITFFNKEKSCSLEINNNKRESTVIGTYTTKSSDDKMKIMIKFGDETPGLLKGEIIITTGSGGEKLKTVIKTKDGVKIDSEYKEGGDGSCEGYNNYGEGRCREIVTTITDSNGGRQVIISDEGTGVIKETKGDDVILYPEPSDDAPFWEQISYIVAELRVSYFIESPPLAYIFAECEWKDWVNNEYPDSRGEEWEMKKGVKKDRKMCGANDASHYVDAVTIEDQIPWHELKAENGQQYEVYKLTPFHGYICNDKNMPNDKRYCKDMKVRYCCAKTSRAQWSLWGEWSECTLTCGGGKKTRTKTCKQARKHNRVPGYTDKCLGEDDPVRKKQMSEQTVSCNVKGCPVDFIWTRWAPWSSCSVSCSNGTKERDRNCYPSQNGGAECPDKLKEEHLYRQIEDCTKADCEKFVPGEWTAWSICSASCGKGKVSRTRICKSTTTLRRASENKCASENSYFYQDNDCLLQECPVNGKWGDWTYWSSCDHSCVPHPESNGKTKARRSRKRHCIGQAFRGKDCKKDKKNKWLSHEKAEKQEDECITELTKKDGEEPTPWCPENCILTEWCEWSTCSQTCIQPIVRNRNTNFNIHHDRPVYRKAKMIRLSYPEDTKDMPERTRFRHLFKEARFNGTCPIELKKGDSKNKLDWQREDCPLCEEHCPLPKRGNVLDWPALSYPHPKVPNCVGYCPVNCEWEDIVQTSDCRDLQNDHYKEKKKYYADKKNTREIYAVFPFGGRSDICKGIEERRRHCIHEGVKKHDQ